MKVIKGSVRYLDTANRILEIKTPLKIEYLYLTRSLMNRFKVFLKEETYVELEATNQSELKDDRMLYEIVGFIKIVQNTTNKTNVLYDVRSIRRGIAEVLNKDTNKMFIDLEFTMPEYGSHAPFKSEIIQFGYIVEDNKGVVIDSNSSLIKINQSAISNRTLEFVNRTIEEFDDAITQEEFYEIFKEALEKYDPTIIVWGSNDILMLDAFYKDLDKEPLTTRASFINVMQLIKNYFGMKYDIGLFKAKTFFSEKESDDQAHDALTDAETTQEVFHLFKEYTKKIG